MSAVGDARKRNEAPVTGLTDDEREALDECGCGHSAHRHNSTGCESMDGNFSYCFCEDSPSGVIEGAVARIIAAREQALVERIAQAVEAVAPDWDWDWHGGLMHAAEIVRTFKEGDR